VIHFLITSTALVSIWLPVEVKIRLITHFPTMWEDLITELLLFLSNWKRERYNLKDISFSIFCCFVAAISYKKGQGGTRILPQVERYCSTWVWPSEEEKYQKILWSTQNYPEVQKYAYWPLKKAVVDRRKLKGPHYSQGMSWALGFITYLFLPLCSFSSSCSFWWSLNTYLFPFLPVLHLRMIYLVLRLTPYQLEEIQTLWSSLSTEQFFLIDEQT